jgi:hypothetical protein
VAAGTTCRSAPIGWTTDELRAKLQANGFAIISVDPGPPIVIVAERATH